VKKYIIVTAILLFISVGFIALNWPLLRAGFTSSAYYTLQDKWEYDYYTPELLKRAPRISDHYNFSYGRISGSEAEVFTIKFYGVSSTQSIREYLKAEGYEPQTECNVQAECWQSSTVKDEVSVGNIQSQIGVFIQIYRPL